MLRKLDSLGLPLPVVRFLQSCLDDRQSVVVFGGQFSSESLLSNSLFQGTVLGLPLWNWFFGDAEFASQLQSFIEAIFASDFDAWRNFAAATAPQQILDECRKWQANIHQWGRANLVKFNAAST